MPGEKLASSTAQGEVPARRLFIFPSSHKRLQTFFNHALQQTGSNDCTGTFLIQITRNVTNTNLGMPRTGSVATIEPRMVAMYKDVVELLALTA